MNPYEVIGRERGESFPVSEHDVHGVLQNPEINTMGTIWKCQVGSIRMSMCAIIYSRYLWV